MYLPSGVRRAGRAHQGARHVEGQGGGGGDRGVRAGARGRRSLRGPLIARGGWCEPADESRGHDTRSEESRCVSYVFKKRTRPVSFKY